jgi:hypothetical protein
MSTADCCSSSGEVESNRGAHATPSSRHDVRRGIGFSGPLFRASPAHKRGTMRLRHAAALRSGAGRDRSPPMENATDLSLSPSEKRTLQHLVEGELHTTELDWVALQHLKKHGLAEDRPAGVGITKEGRRVLRRLMAGSASV